MLLVILDILLTLLKKVLKIRFSGAEAGAEAGAGSETLVTTFATMEMRPKSCRLLYIVVVNDLAVWLKGRQHRRSQEG